MRGVEGKDYRIHPAVQQASRAQAYERQPTDPPSRPLRIFALDPAASRREGSIATIAVPYEPLACSPRGGFSGAMFAVDPHDGGTGVTYETLDLNQVPVLLQSGRDPSPSDPLFHQQMVYAVCATVYASFRKALGRQPTWGFDRSEEPRLVLRPYGALAENAWYAPDQGALVFGYFQATDKAKGRTPPSGLVFSSLSHDIVTHEVTHALLDGLRRPFTEPTNPDVTAFHEGFADLMAIFHRFSYRDVVRVAIARAHGKIEAAELLGDIARQFGQALGDDHGIRTPIEAPGAKEPRRYDPRLEAHQLGTILVSAVFEAFATIVGRKTARHVRLATGGTGILPAGDMPHELCDMMAKEASDVAQQFLEICIRAVDYCPPVDVTFGEFLRAMMTADAQLVFDDPWGYREAWIDAFRARGIFPDGVAFLSEDALVWRGPAQALEPIDRLAFKRLRFNGDPARPASAKELHRQARALGAYITDPRNAPCFGIAFTGDPALDGDAVDPPVVQSVRTARRVGSDGQVLFDLVAEVTQVRHVQRGGVRFPFLGGATVIIGPDGAVRYLISKSVLNERRLEAQATYMGGEQGKAMWEVADGRWQRRPELFKLLHGHAAARASAV